MRVDIVTIFPDYLAPLQLSLVGRAIREGRIQLSVHDLRTWTHDVHRTVDDAPFGGGPGMLMRPEPWGEALAAVAGAGREALGRAAVPHLLVPSPAGWPLTQRRVAELAAEPWLVVACGRYEGIDERVLLDAAERGPVTPISIGDYVLAGGEVAALVVVEAVGRLLPGVLGNRESVRQDSHSEGLLEHPAYTRPARWRGHAVPEVLTSGDHARVARWRRDESLRRTARRRPDLVAALDPALLDRHDLAVLDGQGWQVSAGRLQPRGAAVAEPPSRPVARADEPERPGEAGEDTRPGAGIED